MYGQTLTKIFRLVFMASCVSALFLGGFSQASAESFKIGAICALTGPAAAFGIETCAGEEAWVKSKNAAGGLNGMEIELIKYDTETSTAGAVNAYRRLVQDKVRIIWMWTSSNSILAVKPLASEGQIPIISGGGSDRIVVPPDPWVFKPGTMSSHYAQGLLKWAQKQGFKTIATLSATDAYGQSEKEKIAQYAPEFGIKVLAQETFAPADTNFTAQLVKIRNKKPDLLYSAAAGGPAIISFQQIKQFGIDVPIAISPAALNAAFFKGVGGKKNLEGIYSATNLGTFGYQLTGEALKNYKTLSEVLGHDATLMETFGWDSGPLTEWALNHSDGTPKGLRDAIESAKGVKLINGECSFAPDKHAGFGVDDIAVGVFKDEVFVFAD